jgi:ribonuclease BN (tRNA processing enzyme)
MGRNHRGSLALALLAALAGSAARAQDTAVVVLVGTGFPRPDPAAAGPATAVVVGQRVFLFDAGAGIQRALSAARLPIDGVTALFVTHLHSDHTLGLPDLILDSWVMGRHTPLPAYGPPGLSAMIAHILAAWTEDLRVRVQGLEHDTPVTPQVRVHEIASGVVYDSGGVRVTAVAVPHGALRHAFAYRLDAGGRSIVISGDTRPSPALERLSAGVDVLVHEVYASETLAPESRPGGEDWPRYMHDVHTSDVELGAIAARARPRILVLTHMIRMGAADSTLLAGVRRGGFTGRTVIGHDGDRY